MPISLSIGNHAQRVDVRYEAECFNFGHFFRLTVGLHGQPEILPKLEIRVGG